MCFFFFFFLLQIHFAMMGFALLLCLKRKLSFLSGLIMGLDSSGAVS